MSILLSFYLVLQPGLATAAPSDTGEVVATSVSGAVTFTRPGLEGVHKLKKGEVVRVADTLETAADARVQVRLPDGVVINISPGSVLRISQYAFTKSTLRRSSVINLLKGSARFFVQNPEKLMDTKSLQPQRLEGSSFLIETAQAHIRLWGSDVVVEATPEMSTVCVLGGGAALRNKSSVIIGDVSVGENLCSIVRTKEPPTIPSILSQQQRRIYTKDARQF